ncbi:MAG: carboxypeptidase regulatory-like domain-containing protein [Planctomycetes bacterium]|nr:carboxypeptidase regulatory-like domain-containing protein [Planctomycetota bacterium]
MSRRLTFLICLIGACALYFCIFIFTGLESIQNVPRGSAAAPSRPRNVIFGRVVDANGAPIPDVQISIFNDLAKYSVVRIAAPAAWERMRASVATVMSGANGEFEFHAVAMKNLDLVASKSGFGLLQMNDRHAGDSARVVIRRAAALTGRVLRDDGTPVEGAIVRVSYGRRRPELWYREFTTDRDGAFAARDLAPGAVDIDVRSARECNSSARAALLADGETTDITMTLDRGSYIYGRVESAGKPVEGAEVSDDILFSRKVTTDADGLYMLDGVRAGVGATIHFRAAGFGAATATIPLVRENGTGQNCYLTRGRGARGRIVNSDGRPVEGAYVAAGYEYGADINYRDAFTGAGGAFSFDGLARGKHHTLLIRMEGFASVQYVFPRNEALVETVEFGDVMIHPGSVISGIVIDRDGRPIANVSVSARGVNADTDRFADGAEFPGELLTLDHRSITGGDGRYYIINLAAGAFSVSAWLPVSCEEVAPRQVVLREGERVSNCDFKLSTEGRIAGIVMGPGGAPVAGAFVSVLRPPPPGPLKPGSRPAIFDEFAYLHTDATGGFSFIGLANGKYTLQIDTRSNYYNFSDAGGSVCAAALKIQNVATGSLNLQIKLPLNAPVRGRVVDRDGAPIAGAMIFDPSPDGYLATPVYTDNDGGFQFDAAENSTIRLRVFAPAFDDAGQNPVERKFVDAEFPAGKKDAVIRLVNYP